MKNRMQRHLPNGMSIIYLPRIVTTLVQHHRKGMVRWAKPCKILEGAFSSPAKQVEKQRILRESIGRSVDLTNKINSENQASTVVNVQVMPAIIATKPASIEGSNTPKATLVQRQKIASIAPYSQSDNNKKFPAIGMNLKAPGDSKRPASCSASFFDRFRKGISMNSKNPGDTSHKAATTERDSRPFLFKYNEGFTNAVKRPVKIRELLL